VLESVAYQVRDVVEAMASDRGSRLVRLKVDGGMSANNWLMQFQADQLNCTVERPKVVESTAFGAAALAALGLGWLSQPKDLLKVRELDREFSPGPAEAGGYDLWKRAVERSLAWQS